MTYCIICITFGRWPALCGGWFMQFRFAAATPPPKTKKKKTKPKKPRQSSTFRYFGVENTKSRKIFAFSSSSRHNENTRMVATSGRRWKVYNVLTKRNKLSLWYNSQMLTSLSEFVIKKDRWRRFIYYQSISVLL